MPMHTVANRPVAVVKPFTCWWATLMMMPAPRKPMPVMTCAPRREASNFMPTSFATADQGPVSIAYS